MNKYIEPRLRRDFGGIITAYFDFLKANIKGLLNTFIAYNGIFLALFLVSSYLLVTGVVQEIYTSRNYTPGTPDDNSSAMMAGFGIILFILTAALASLVNYGLSASYVSLYEKNKKNLVPRGDVWKYTLRHAGGLFLFALVAVGLYIAFVIFQTLISIIPVIGFLISMAMGLVFNAWLSLSIFSYLHNPNHNIFDGLGEGWTLLFSGFWKTLGVNFILGLIVQTALIALNLLPSILVGVYVYHSVQEGLNISDNLFGQVLIVVMLTLFCVLFLFSQSLSQTINSFLYFNLHEFKHNEYLRTRIEKLGVRA